MGILNTVWWTTGVLMAAPLVRLGVDSVLASSYPKGALFLAVGLLVLLLPEYVRWRLLGGSSPFERVPFVGPHADDGEE